MSVLVTGGTGTVGLAVGEALVASGEQVVCFGAAPPPVPLAGLEVVVGDVRDQRHLAQVIADHKVDVVVHGAALTPDAAAERERPTEVLDINCVAVAGVLRTAHAVGVQRVLYLGSIAAYGSSASSEPLLVEEQTPDRPHNLYEISKCAGERAALRLGELLGMQVASLRLGDLFGRWEHPTGARPVMSAIHQVTALAVAGSPARLPRPGRKAWTYAADVGTAVRRLLAQSWHHRVYNLASPHVWSVADWCQRLAERLDFTYRVGDERPNVAMFADNAPMSSERLTAELGWAPEYDLDAAFGDYLTWITEGGRWSLGPAGRPR